MRLILGFLTIAFFSPLTHAETKPVAPALVPSVCPNVVMKGSAYPTARALYQSGLIHSAFKGFANVLTNPQELPPAKVAAAECIRQIELAHPSIKMNPGVVSQLLLAPAFSLEPYASKLHPFLWTLLVRGQINPNDYPKKLLSRKDDQAAVALIGSMKEVQKNPTAASLPKLLNALSQVSSLPEPALFKPLVNLAELTAARLLYMAERYPEALQRTKAILKKYPSLPEAYELAAWINLAMKKGQESVQNAVTLRSPSLKNYFTPQSTLLPAMVFLDYCDYSSAKPHLGYFRVKYKKEADYLSKPNTDYYADLLAVLNQKGNVSPKIIASWVASPTVIALIDENNLIVDEKAAATRLKNSTAQSELIEREKTNLAALRAQLNYRSSALKSDLNDAIQNAALIEVDVLLGMSKQLAHNEAAKPVDAKASATPAPQAAPKWSWEKKDFSSMENEEIWADELGNFDLDLKNNCK